MASTKITGDYMVLNNADYLFDYYKDIDLVQIDSGSIKRSFCKCGHVEKDCTTYKCPKCGNNKPYFVRFYNYSSYRDGQFRKCHYITYNKDKSIAHFNVYQVCITEDATKKEFIVEKIKEEEVVKIDKTNLEILNNSFFTDYGYTRKYTSAIGCIESLYVNDLNCFGFEDFKKEFKYFDKDFDKFNFKDVFNEFRGYSYVEDFQIYFAYISIKKRLPEFFTSPIFPDVFLSQLILSGQMFDIKNFSSIKKIITDLGLSDFEEYLNQKWFYSVGNRNIKITEYSRLNKEQKELIQYAIGHYKMPIDKVESLSKSLARNSYLYTDKLESLFLGFIKSNLVIFMDRTIDEFEKRINFLNSHKIPINENSIKNFSVFKNIEDLKEQKYPEKNVNLISDVFYDNPLKAMKYLKSKTPLTKQEIDDLLNLIK